MFSSPTEPRWNGKFFLLMRKTQLDLFRPGSSGVERVLGILLQKGRGRGFKTRPGLQPLLSCLKEGIERRIKESIHLWKENIYQ